AWVRAGPTQRRRAGTQAQGWDDVVQQGPVPAGPEPNRRLLPLRDRGRSLRPDVVVSPPEDSTEQSLPGQSGTPAPRRRQLVYAGRPDRPRSHLPAGEPRAAE